MSLKFNLLSSPNLLEDIVTDEDDPITRNFIGHAMKVHSKIGPGVSEEIYHRELVAAMNAAGIKHLSKPRRDLMYRGIVADSFEPDFVVEDHFIPELKCLRGSFAGEHMVQVFCYCKFWRLRTSMLVDFGKQSLIWKRLFYQSRSALLPDVSIPDFVPNATLAHTIIHAVAECLNEIGLGYRETTWRGLVKAALQSAGLRVQSEPTATVLDHPVVTFPVIVVENSFALLTIALAKGIEAADRAVLQTNLRWLNLEWGIVFNFGKTSADFCFVRRPQ